MEAERQERQLFDQVVEPGDVGLFVFEYIIPFARAARNERNKEDQCQNLNHCSGNASHNPEFI